MRRQPNLLVTTHLLATSLLLAGTVLPSLGAAAVLPAQAVLRSAAGGPVADGTYIVFARLFDEEKAALPVWEEVLTNVQVQQGFFTVLLGNQPGKAIPGALLTSGKPLWFEVQVGSDPALSRVVLHDVPRAFFAHNAAGLSCSGCVVEAALATGSVTAAKVAFAYAGSDQKGGPATFALDANHAKAADSAKTADKAVSAEEALTAVSAQTAAKLQCTGCVTAAMLADDVKKAYLPIAGGALSGGLATGGDVAVGGKLDVKGKATLQGGTDHQWQPATQFRFQVANAPPAPCDAKLHGGVYLDGKTNVLRICNGVDWVTVKALVALGTQASPASSCKAVKDADPTAKSGKVWLDVDGSGPALAIEAWCDLVTDGGGYGWVKIDDKSLGGDQTPYGPLCAKYGMEVVVMRTQAHAAALKASAEGVPNLVNVFPKSNGASGLQNWQGICQGKPCGFYFNGDASNANPGFGFEPNGDNNTSCRLYRYPSSTTLAFGTWNDGNCSVEIPGSVVCSPNDK